MSIGFEKCNYSPRHVQVSDALSEIESNSSSYRTCPVTSKRKRRSNCYVVSSIVETVGSQLHKNKDAKRGSFQYARNENVQVGCIPGYRRRAPKQEKRCNDNLTPWECGSWDRPRHPALQSYCSDEHSSRIWTCTGFSIIFVLYMFYSTNRKVGLCSMRSYSPLIWVWQWSRTCWIARLSCTRNRDLIWSIN